MKRRLRAPRPAFQTTPGPAHPVAPEALRQAFNAGKLATLAELSERLPEAICKIARSRLVDGSGRVWAEAESVAVAAAGLDPLDRDAAMALAACIDMAKRVKAVLHLAKVQFEANAPPPDPKTLS